MADQFPLITICSPCYNHARYVEESLDSIRNQTYPNIQHIIIDDCSTDNSAEVIEAWIKKHNYACTYIRHKQNVGLSATFNESISLAEGEFWCGLATDDAMFPERVEVLGTYLQAHPETLMVTGDSVFMDEHSKVFERKGSSSTFAYYSSNVANFNIEEFGTYEELLKGNTVSGSLLIRKSAFEKAGLFSVGLKMEDWDMWLRISRLSRIAFINRPLGYYRDHPDNLLKDKTSMEFGMARTFLQQYEYCRANNLQAAYRRAYLGNPFYSPLRHPALTWQFMRTGPVHLYAYKVMRRIASNTYHSLKKKLSGSA